MRLPHAAPAAFRLLAVLAVLAVMAPATRARADSPAEQLAGLFVQGCVAHAGSISGLRQWAAAKGLKSVPAQAAPAFLNKQPGIAYDASDPGGKFVLISDDGGGCAAIAQHADRAVLAATLSQFLARAGLPLVQISEEDDPLAPGVRH
ncbi:NMCC_0638 family (lipo)protein, partial [Acidisphaera rubrifaciens]|uniref:NMCC_0638 family (lipo)protein n=1 Tax=Acidisphaera rubrifaciens TaxID=50715 RepID=UPI000662AF52